MTTSTTRLILVCVGVLAVCGLVAAVVPAHAAPLTPQTEPGDPLDPRTYAPDSTPFLAVAATGVQKYACQANGTWLFTDPVAVLHKPTRARNPIGTHYLNFATGRPVWESRDGSTVEAARKATAPAGTGNIPALLLQAVVTTGGSDGNRLSGTTWVQRLNTAGGVAPAGACTPGDTSAVPYTADYVFWKVDVGERGRVRRLSGTGPGGQHRPASTRLAAVGGACHRTPHDCTRDSRRRARAARPRPGRRPCTRPSSRAR